VPFSCPGGVAQLADLSSHLFHAIIAFDSISQEPAGFTLYTIRYSPTSRFLHMSCLYAREAHQGKGLALRLMQELAVAAEKKQLPRIQWVVKDGNVRARKFYEKVKTNYLLIPDVNFLNCTDWMQ